MPGPSPSFNFGQYPTDPTAQTGRSFDPSQASANTGIAGGGGATTPIDSNGATQGGPGMGGMAGGLPIPPAANGSTSTSQDPWTYFDQIFPGSSLSPQDLLAHEADLKAHGITLIKNAAGLPGKVQLADGSAYDVIGGAGAGQNIKQRNQIAGPGGVPTGGGVNGSAGSVLGGLGYSFGDSMQKFQDPTAQQALDSPGLQFALSEANRMGQNSAAAKGTLLNGRFQQALNASNIQNALQGYQGVYDRAFQTFTRNQDAPFQKQYNLATLGKPT